MFTYDDALEIATVAHAAQTDKTGSPYVDYLKTIADNLKVAGESEEVQIVALLQDMMGDAAAYSSEKLLSMGVPESIVATLSTLAHHKNQSFIDEYSCQKMAEGVPAEEAAYEAREKDYLHYIEKMMANPVARKVKIETLKTLLDEKHIPKNERREKKTRFRIQKYQAALALLEG